MEIDHARRLRCFNCSKPGHTAKFCKANVRTQVNATAQQNQAQRYEGQNLANIRCYNCSRFGHMAQQCTWPRSHPRREAQNVRNRNETSQPPLN